MDFSVRFIGLLLLDLLPLALLKPARSNFPSLNFLVSSSTTLSLAMWSLPLRNIPTWPPRRLNSLKPSQSLISMAAVLFAASLSKASRFTSFLGFFPGAWYISPFAAASRRALGLPSGKMSVTSIASPTSVCTSSRLEKSDPRRGARSLVVISTNPLLLSIFEAMSCWKVGLVGTIFLLELVTTTFVPVSSGRDMMPPFSAVALAAASWSCDLISGEKFALPSATERRGRWGAPGCVTVAWWSNSFQHFLQYHILSPSSCSQSSIEPQPAVEHMGLTSIVGFSAFTLRSFSLDTKSSKLCLWLILFLGTTSCASSSSSTATSSEGGGLGGGFLSLLPVVSSFWIS
mmetsp:Transcript_23805/g.44747  ORF Transcript_23805/g.44747 Transcript_23805/m.44747 type:complete len:345 (+) Transcript_23805:389-1423(+)